MAFITPTPAGDYRFRADLLQQQAGPTNELGETTPSTVAVRTVWAKISPVSSAKKMANAQMTLDITHMVRMRYVPWLDQTYTLRYQGRLFDILDIRDVEEQRIELELTCHEQKGNGGAK